MSQGKQRSILRTKDYLKFRDPIEEILKQAKEPLTWTEIKAKAGFKQKVPNNKWVRRMEEDIGLVRERTRDGKTLRRLL